jgi:uncharacterized protein DUF5666
MRISRTVVMVAAVLVLAGCRGHEAITGGYGNQGVTGVVTMAAGMSNSSPAGVRVAVGGTGMSAVLGTDGRFSFFGIPETADLIFTREDVNARLRVVPSAAPLLIELTSNSVRSRRRAAPSVPLLQIEGLIKTAGTDQIVVSDSHKEDVTVKITADTIIRKGDQKVPAGDLKVGDRVHVKASVKDDVKTAVEIIVQKPEDEDKDEGGETMTANGTVTANDSSQLTVSTVPRGDVTVKVDDKTIIKKQGDRISITDIKPGDQVNCMGKRIDDRTLLARQIEVRGVSGRK